jgi:hypothetical protein
MDEVSLSKLKYPIGDFIKPESFDEIDIAQWILEIEKTPQTVKKLISELSASELSLNYRPGGWNIAQVVHHMCDSHTNAFIRIKLALTEDNPTIKPYEEALWAELADYKIEHLHHTIQMLEALHAKFCIVLKNMDIQHFKSKSYFHPASNKTWILGDVLALYAWHCKHHIAHIQQALHHRGVFI